MAQADLPAWQDLQAPAGWHTLEFISDLHLQAAEPATFQAWQRYLAQSQADAIFILGDLFEAWAGDDMADGPGFESGCARILREAANRRPMFFMRGNRDFLIGQDFSAKTGVTLLDDPTVLLFGGRRWLLTHGDALCVDDLEYQRFRAQVRDAAWQRAFLSRPLEDRRAVARAVREQSARGRSMQGMTADIDTASAIQWLQATGAATMVHGHTHKPADHRLGVGLWRIVLSDWDAAASPPRMQVMRLSASGLHRTDFS